MFGEELNWLNGKEQKNREVRKLRWKHLESFEYWMMKD